MPVMGFWPHDDAHRSGDVVDEVICNVINTNWSVDTVTTLKVEWVCGCGSTTIISYMNKYA